MQPTDASDFLERVAALLALAPGEVPGPPPSGSGEESLLKPPMTALLTPPRGFAEVYGQDGRMLLALLAADARLVGNTALANLVLALEAGLGDGSLRPVEGPQPVRRADYVYPVI